MINKHILQKTCQKRTELYEKERPGMADYFLRKILR